MQQSLCHQLKKHLRTSGAVLGLASLKGQRGARLTSGIRQLRGVSSKSACQQASAVFQVTRRVLPVTPDHKRLLLRAKEATQK